MVRRALKLTPLGRAAEPDDVADAVAFLALGQTLMTGQVVVVDGGRTMQGAKRASVEAMCLAEP